MFLGATLGVLLEIIATLIDEIITGNLFTDEVFASVNLITPYTLFEVFIAYLVTVAAAALIVRARGAGDTIRMSELFSQTIIVCGMVGVGLTLIYVAFTPQLVRLVADDQAVYDNALAYFKAMRFYPLANKTAVIEGIAVTVVLVLIAPLVPRVLNVTDPELVRWVVLGMRLIALGSTFMSLLYLITSYYLVIDQIVLGTVACALRDVMLSAGLAFVLGKALGITGMFVGLAAVPALAYVLLMVIVTARYGREDCPLLLSSTSGITTDGG